MSSTGDVRGDGSCFFRALINYCTYNQKHDLLGLLVQVFSGTDEEWDIDCSDVLCKFDATSNTYYSVCPEGDIENTLVMYMRRAIAVAITRGLTPHGAIFKTLRSLDAETRALCLHELNTSEAAAIDTALQEWDLTSKEKRKEELPGILERMCKAVAHGIIEMSGFVSYTEVEHVKACLLKRGVHLLILTKTSPIPQRTDNMILLRLHHEHYTFVKNTPLDKGAHTGGQTQHTQHHCCHRL